MKNLIEAYDTRHHALVITNIYVKYKDQEPIWTDKTAGLAETENIIGNVVIYETDEIGKVSRIEVSSSFIIQIADKIKLLKETKTEPDFPEY